MTTVQSVVSNRLEKVGISFGGRGFFFSVAKHGNTTRYLETRIMGHMVERERHWLRGINGMQILIKVWEIWQDLGMFRRAFKSARWHTALKEQAWNGSMSEPHIWNPENKCSLWPVCIVISNPKQVCLDNYSLYCYMFILTCYNNILNYTKYIIQTVCYKLDHTVLCKLYYTDCIYCTMQTVLYRLYCTNCR